MDSQRLEDTLAETLAELKAMRQLAVANGQLVVIAWRIAELEGHAFGPALPETLQVNQIPQALGPLLTPRLEALLQAQAPQGTPGAGPTALTPRPSRKRDKRAQRQTETQATNGQVKEPVPA